MRHLIMFLAMVSAAAAADVEWTGDQFVIDGKLAQALLQMTKDQEYDKPERAIEEMLERVTNVKIDVAGRPMHPRLRMMRSILMPPSAKKRQKAEEESKAFLERMAEELRLHPPATPTPITTGIDPTDFRRVRIEGMRARMDAMKAERMRRRMREIMKGGGS